MKQNPSSTAKGIALDHILGGKKVVSLIFSPLFPKTVEDGLQSDIGIERFLGHTTPDWTEHAVHTLVLQFLAARRTIPR